MTYPRRNQNGDLVPELGDYLRGARELDKLEAQGLVVDRTLVSATELGRAVADAEPRMTPERRAQLLAMAEEIEARNKVEHQGLLTGRIRATPEELEVARVEHDAQLTGTRAKELELVRRHNSAVSSGDDRYTGLYLDQLFAQGRPILDLDPEPQVDDHQPAGLLPDSVIRHDGAQAHQSSTPDDRDRGKSERSDPAQARSAAREVSENDVGIEKNEKKG